MNDIAGIIFDCDGVLFESRQANLAYYNTVLEHFDEPLVSEQDREKALLCHTAESRTVFAELLGQERVEQALDFSAEIDFRQFIPFMIPEPGLSHTLAELADNLPLAVATNRGNSMPQILSHFGLAEFFQTVVTSRDVPRPKPHPDMLFEACERLKLPPGRLLFVGDSILDGQAARAAGIRFAIYKGNLEADVRVGSHRELACLVLGNEQ